MFVVEKAKPLFLQTSEHSISLHQNLRKFYFINVCGKSVKNYKSLLQKCEEKNGKCLLQKCGTY